jgi:zinc protease
MMTDIDGKAEELGHFETTLGDFRQLNAMAERLAAATPDDIARVIRTYLVPARRTIVIAEPEPDSDDADDDDDDDDDETGAAA